jgi:ribosomal protein L16/L10AE
MAFYDFLKDGRKLVGTRVAPFDREHAEKALDWAQAKLGRVVVIAVDDEMYSLHDYTPEIPRSWSLES